MESTTRPMFTPNTRTLNDLDIANTTDVRHIAEKIRSAILKPFRLQNEEFFVTASIGVCVYPSGSRDTRELIRNADAAMYQAKVPGTNKIICYNAEMNRRATERLSLERDLHRALDRGQFQLLYQPQVDITSGEIIGAEALLRCEH